jgi:hypothetical protein
MGTGFKAPGGQATNIISASTVEATVSSQEDEKGPRTVHGSETGPCHIE